ncbi:MAG: hypothetical protein COA49_02265 [Bacteroidetes bacterium]|nr:MAG: hypothetical protein COA49_02265 [Bacteroidota bacterium]
MIKNITLLLSLSIVVLLSCNSSDSSNNLEKATPSKSTETSEEAVLPNGLKNLSDAEKRGMRLLKRRQDAKIKDSKVKENNMSSAFKYLTTSDDYPIFTSLMVKSSLAKFIHSGDVTVLAPVDKAFDILPNYKDLLLPGNEDLLDEFISHHIIDISMEYKAFTDERSWRVHTGESLPLTNKGGIDFNGAHVRSGSVNTEVGSIIGMDELVYYPKL